MKKNIFLLLLIVLGFTAGALPVDSERAILAAKNFVMQRTGATQVSATVVYAHYMPQSGLPSMYAVNINYGSGAARTSGNGGRGFVLIAADDVAYPVLGYNFGSQWPTTAGAKAGGSIEPLCAQLTDYLDDLSTQIEGASHTIGSTVEWQQLASPNAPLLAAAIDSVGPLIETQWSQGQYYNAMCPANTSGPDGHALTGCVATAMAQIVRYWEYPVHGRGTHSFSDNSNGTEGTFSADFENATYDYAHMPIRLSSTNSATEVNAVAQLMYHCGVACDMKYGASASGSYDIVARAGLVNYFRYSPDISFVEKARVTAAQWDSILHAHIGANQPVMFCGQGNYGGHAFICDGYKTDGYYHFNFGWSGSADGWYLTSAVNPSIYTFNTNQSILTGIVPYNNGNVILANRRGASTFTVGTEPLEFYHTRGHDSYRANCYTNDCSNTVLFTSTDASKQLVLDINAAEGQNLSVYDGEGGSQLTTISSGSISGSSQVISSDHTLYLDYNGSFLCNGFKVTIGQNIESTRTVTVLSNNSEMGSVTGGGVHALGGTATLTATPNCGYRFVRWMSNGETVSTNPTFNITVTQDTSFTAVFDEMTVSTGIELVCSTGQTLVYDLNCPDNCATLTGYSGSCSGALAIPDTITVEGNKYPVTRIGEDAFSNCHYITSLTLGNNVTTIERQAFIYCSRLTSLYIPTSVTSIGSFVFFGCSDLESIIVSPDNPVYDSRNNCNALIETSSDWLIAGCQNTIIPEDVVGLGYGSFIYSKLRSIIIPNSVTYVERYTFGGCDSLTSIVVTPGNPVFDSRNNCNAIIQTSTNKLVAGCKTTVIPDDIAVIGQTAFYNCHLLPSITLPATLTSIEQRAIYSCSSLTRIVIPESVTEIGEYAFFNCRNLKSINIPAGVTYIDNKTFYDCLSLDSVFLASTTPPALHDTAFNTHPTFYIPCGSTATYQSAWGMDYTFSEAGLIYNVTHIAPSGQTLTYILDCGNHTATLQGYNSCNGSLVIPNEITHNGDIYVVRSIADSLFYGCSGLTALVIPDSLTYIGTAAFHNCENLRKVSFGSSMDYIGNMAFGLCSNIDTIISSNPVPPSAEGALNGVGDETVIMVPCASVATYQNATDWSHFSNIRCESTPQRFRVTVTSSYGSLGTVEGGGEYNEGETATITVTPNYGYLFSRWSDGSTDNPRSLVVTQDTTLTAIFVPYYAVVPSPYPYLEIKNKYNEYHQWIGDTLTLNAGEALTLNAEGQIPVKYFNGTYRVEEIPYAPTDTSFWLNGEGRMMSVTMDDQFTSAMTIPAGFSFYFFGIKKNELRIGDNGMMTFTSDFGMDHPARADECPYSFNAAIPWNESNTPGSSGNCFHRMHDAVYGFYEDLYTSSMNMGGEYATLYPHCGVWYGIVDSWPQRKIMASWKSVPIFNNANVRETFQIVAYEGTNIIEIHVKERNGGTSMNGGRGILGIQNATGQPQVQGDMGSSTSHVVPGSPAAFWPAGLNNTTASVMNRSFRFTPEGAVAPYTVTWKRVLEDGRVVVVNGADGSDTNGYAVPSTDDKYFDLQATPQSTSKYICEVKYQDADNWWYTLSDTIVVKVEREEEDNLHRVTAKTYPAGDPNIRVTGLNATGMYEDGASVTLYADNSGNENYVFVAWMSGRVLLGNQPTLTLSPIVSDTTVTAYFMVEEHPELIDYLIYDDEMLKRKVIGVKETYRNRITTAVIPRTVTAIGDGAFRGCTAMTHLTIPAGVAQLGNYVFDGCTALTEVEMHEGLTLGNYLFNNCTSLETVELPTGLTTIPEGLFYGCTALREVVLPTGVTDIGAYAYYGCSRVYTLNLPATVQRVGAQAFASMTSLHFVTLAAGLQELGNDCFRNSLNIVKTDFTGALTDWLAISFGNANSQPVARSRNLWLNGSMLTRIEVPAGINAIKPYSFFNDTLITHITLPAGITSIGNLAFGRLKHLERIVLEGVPAGVHSGSFQSVNHERVIVEVPCRYYREGMTWEGFTHVVSKGMPILTLQQRPGGKVMFLDQPNCDAAEYSYTITAIHGVNNTFTSWSDGNTDNPRTLVLTEDMTLSPIWGRNPNATSVNVMFFDFENPQDEASWTSENESANRWVVGEAAHFNRSGKGLYVSNDNGLHNHYDPSSSPYTYSEFLFDTGYYRFTYNYMVGGNEGDFMSAGLFYEDGSYAMLTPHGEGGIMISDSLYGLDPDLDPWGYQERIIHIDSGGWYRLAFFWTANEDNEVNNPGGAVDNVMITHEDYRTLRSRVAMVYVSSNDEAMGYAYTGSTPRDSVNQTSFNYYFWDDVIEIHAHSHEGYRFVRWSDGNTNAHRTLRFLDIAGVAAHFTAYFEAIPDHYTVTVDIESGATEGSLQFGVEINGEMRHYAEVTNHEPAVVKLNLPQAGWTFLGWWNGNDTLHQNPYTYMGGQNIHLTALMKEWQSCNGNGEGDNYDFGSRIPRREGFEYQFSLTDDAVVTNVKVFDRNGQIIVDHAPGFKVTVYDVNGRIIDTKKGKEEPLVFDVVVSGSYMVKIGDLMTTKVVVIK